jgi:ubiquinone/menaquinone biosynthesis C-methylase UbiE
VFYEKSLTGVDLSEGMLDIAKKQTRKSEWAGVYEEVLSCDFI